MDLTRAVAFRSFALNTVTLAAGGIPYGCTVDSCDYSQLEVAQVTEKLARADGLDVGGVWLGARHVTMTGTIYDVSRGAAFDRLATLDAALAPTAEFAATPSSFGFAPLTFYIRTASNVAQKTLSVRSNGLRADWQRAMFGGNDADPLAIPWSVTFLSKAPAIASELVYPPPAIVQQYSFRTGDGAADYNVFPGAVTAGHLLVLAIGARDKDSGGVPPGWQPGLSVVGPSRPFTLWQYTQTPNSGADGKGDPMALLYRVAVGDEQTLYMGATKQQWTMWEIVNHEGDPATYEVIFQTLQSGGTTKTLGSFVTAGAGDLQLAGFTYESDAAIDQTVGAGWTQDQQRKDLTTGGHPGTVQMHSDATNPECLITGTGYPWCGVAVNIPALTV